MLEAGRPAAALAEVTRMPGRAAGSKWMEQARRYIEARRALDLIETAAILEPRRLRAIDGATRSEEHTSELQSLMRISYAVFCLKKNKNIQMYATAHASSHIKNML